MEVYCWNMRDLKKDFKNLENLKIKYLAKLMFILLLKQYTPLLSPLPPSKKKKKSATLFSCVYSNRRSVFQELSVEHDEKKGIYDTTAAGMESNMSRLEQVYWELFLLKTLARSR